MLVRELRLYGVHPMLTIRHVPLKVLAALALFCAGWVTVLQEMTVDCHQCEGIGERLLSLSRRRRSTPPRLANAPQSKHTPILRPIPTPLSTSIYVLSCLTRVFSFVLDLGVPVVLLHATDHTARHPYECS